MLATYVCCNHPPVVTTLVHFKHTEVDMLHILLRIRTLWVSPLPQALVPSGKVAPSVLPYLPARFWNIAQVFQTYRPQHNVKIWIALAHYTQMYTNSVFLHPYMCDFFGVTLSRGPPLRILFVPYLFIPQFSHLYRAPCYNPLSMPVTPPMRDFRFGACKTIKFTTVVRFPPTLNVGFSAWRLHETWSHKNIKLNTVYGK